MKEYVKLGGHWSIGTDSHIGLNPLEEFRMIDYRQRLITNQRNTFEGDGALHLINESVLSGRNAMGIDSANNFEHGKPLDAVVFNAKSHLISETSEKNRLAAILYTSDSSRVIGTLVNGNWIVQQQHHKAGQKIKENFSKAMRELKNR
jgi:formimidoylglutamate deiminase